jgi:hypothetical protein
MLHPAPPLMMELITMCSTMERYLTMVMSAMTTAQPERWGWRFMRPGTSQVVVVRIAETVFVNPMPHGFPVYHFEVEEEGEPRQPPQRTLEGFDVAG